MKTPDTDIPAANEQCGEDRADDAGAVHHRRVEADRAREVLAVHEQRHRRLERRRVERVGDADAAAAWRTASRARRRWRCSRRSTRVKIADERLHRELQLLLRHPVGEHAAGDRQQQERAELHEHHQADECGASGAVVDVGRQREVLHPRADVRQGEAEEDDPEAPVRQRRSGGARLVAVSGRREDFGGGAHRDGSVGILTRRSSYPWPPSDDAGLSGTGGRTCGCRRRRGRAPRTPRSGRPWAVRSSGGCR